MGPTNPYKSIGRTFRSESYIRAVATYSVHEDGEISQEGGKWILESDTI